MTKGLASEIREAAEADLKRLKEEGVLN